MSFYLHALKHHWLATCLVQ